MDEKIQVDTIDMIAEDTIDRTVGDMTAEEEAHLADVMIKEEEEEAHLAGVMIKEEGEEATKGGEATKGEEATKEEEEGIMMCRNSRPSPIGTLLDFLNFRRIFIW